MSKWLLPSLALAVVVAATVPSAADGKKKTAIRVTENGFEPAHITVPADQPVTLVFTRTTSKTCVKRVVVDIGGGKKIDKALPLHKPVEIVATFPEAGELRYACGMDMYSGVITVQ